MLPLFQRGFRYTTLNGSVGEPGGEKLSRRGVCCAFQQRACFVVDERVSAVEHGQWRQRDQLPFERLKACAAVPIQEGLRTCQSDERFSSRSRRNPMRCAVSFRRMADANDCRRCIFSCESARQAASIRKHSSSMRCCLRLKLSPARASAASIETCEKRSRACITT